MAEQHSQWTRARVLPLPSFVQQLEISNLTRTTPAWFLCDNGLDLSFPSATCNDDAFRHLLLDARVFAPARRDEAPPGGEHAPMSQRAPEGKRREKNKQHAERRGGLVRASAAKLIQRRPGVHARASWGLEGGAGHGVG